jgi:hypothetical protein
MNFKIQSTHEGTPRRLAMSNTVQLKTERIAVRIACVWLQRWRYTHHNIINGSRGLKGMNTNAESGTNHAAATVPRLPTVNITSILPSTVLSMDWVGSQQPNISLRDSKLATAGDTSQHPHLNSEVSSDMAAEARAVPYVVLSRTSVPSRRPDLGCDNPVFGSRSSCIVTSFAIYQTKTASSAFVMCLERFEWKPNDLSIVEFGWRRLTGAFCAGASRSQPISAWPI